MSFSDWILSEYPNPQINGQYGLLHIITMVLCATFIILSTILLRNKNQKVKRTFLFVLVGILILFGVTRRVINLYKTTNYELTNVLKILLPRPGCAISCWLVIIATIVNKKFFYNFASIIGILCGLIFFSYPGVGFNNQYILFENLYSIMTHFIFLIISFCFITFKFTEFRYKKIWKELICLAVMIIYVFLEIFVLKIERDPLYFMPGNDIQSFVGFSYGLYLPLYLIFVTLFFNIFYLINDRKIFSRKK